MYAVMLDVRNDVKKEMEVAREAVRISRERAAAKAAKAHVKDAKEEGSDHK